MTNETFPQLIFTSIESMLPAGWRRLVFFAEYGEGFHAIEFYVKDSGGAYTKCFDLDGASRTEMLDQFDVIDAVIKKERTSIDPSKIWSSMTMLVDNTGDFRIEYDYSEHQEDPYSWKNEWKQKYLR